MDSPLIAALAGLILSSAGLTRAAPANWTFVDVTSEVIDKNPPGLGTVFDYAFVDLNDDNLLDIALNNHHQSKPSPIWLGTPDFKFKFWQNMPKDWIPIAGFHLGEVDHNGDGKTDLVCTGNEGGVIVNLNTAKPGTLQPTYRSIPIHKSSHLVSFADFDANGSLETIMRPGLIYEDLEKPPTLTGLQFGNWVVADFNNDGWPDLFAAGEQDRRAHWSGPRKLFRNNQGSLEEIPLPKGLLAETIGGIPKVADFNNDGHFDLYLFGSTSNAPEQSDRTPYPMRLYLGDGQFGFRDVSKEAGIETSRQKIGYSHVYLADIDNDTDLDLINQGNYGTSCWLNKGNGSFTAVPREETREWASASHLRLDDFDMDGKLDVVTGAPGPKWKDRATSIRVFRNDSPNENRWLKLQLRQPGRNSMGIGATVTVFEAGTRKILGTRLLSSDTEGQHPRLHFGLGPSEVVDLEVRFPTTRKTVRFKGLASNRYLVLRPDGSVAPVTIPEPAPKN